MGKLFVTLFALLLQSRQFVIAYTANTRNATINIYIPLKGNTRLIK
jgi:hypothetical protein